MAVGTKGRERQIRTSIEHARQVLAGVRAADAGDQGATPHDLVWTRTQLDVEELAEWYLATELTPEQEEEWMVLFAEIGDAMPAIRRLGLGEFQWPEGHPPLPETGGYRPKVGRDRSMDRGSDTRAEAREATGEPLTEQRPIWPSRGDLDRWKTMPPTERFKDAAYQRYAQSFRTRDSLSRAGKEGYKATVAKYGKDFLHDRAAEKRREREEPRSRAERRMVRMLEEIGEREDRSEYGGARGTYLREHKLAPSRHADFAWPDRQKAIDVWGGVHTRQFFVRQERVQQANQRQIDRARAAGWKLMIVTDEQLRRDNWDETRERVRRFLA
ncbi:MAG: hypothetical protein M3Q29_23090 [Chloroflexota bacterium]|nr:hypothetical protein [Chloroflexota bacterium]